VPLFLDILAILFILFIGYNGFTKGLIEELGRLLGLICAILISVSKSTYLAIELSRIFKLNEQVLFYFSYIALFFITLIISRILTKFVHIAFISGNNRLMNRTLGFFFGSLKGAVSLIALIWFISILPLQKWTNIINENSRLAGYSISLRIAVISFFNWEDPISLSESYIKNLTQP